MDIEPATHLCIRSYCSTQTVTITAHITPTCIVIACIEVRAWIHNVMTRSEQLSIDDVALFVRPGCSFFSHRARMSQRFGVSTGSLHLPTVSKTFSVHNNIFLWSGEIVFLIVVKVTTKTTGFSWRKMLPY